MAKKYLIKGLIENTKSRILFGFFLTLLAIACHSSNPKSAVFLSAKGGEIKLEVDSVLGWSEMAHFPIRIRLTNYTNKKVLLSFDSIPNDYKFQVKNLFITAEKDTFTLGIRLYGEPLILNEKSVTSFVCWGYIFYGEGHFNSFKEIETVFKRGKMQYGLNGEVDQKVAFKKNLINVDTIHFLWGRAF